MFVVIGVWLFQGPNGRQSWEVYRCMFSVFHLKSFLCLSIYIEYHEFVVTPSGLMSILVFFVFHVSNLFSNSENTSLHNSSVTFLSNPPHSMQLICSLLYAPLPHTDALFSVLRLCLSLSGYLLTLFRLTPLFSLPAILEEMFSPHPLWIPIPSSGHCGSSYLTLYQLLDFWTKLFMRGK